MILPIIFPLISSDSVIAGLIGSNPTRFYPHGKAPQKVVAPYCTWFLVSGVPENILDEVPRIDRFNIQIDCWSDNTGDGSDQVQELAEAIRDALEPSFHMVGVVAEGIDPETQRNRIGLQFTIWQDRVQSS